MSSLDPVAILSTALSSLSAFLAPIGGAVAAVVVATLAVRLALHPLTRIAVRSERTRTRLAPRLAEIQARHGSDLGKLSAETMAFYRAEHVSPYAGLVPMLVQTPVFLVLYRVFRQRHGPLATARVWGVPLHAHLLSVVGTGAGPLVFGTLLVLLAALAWATARRTAMVLRASAVPVPSGAVGLLARISPYFLLVSAAVVPLAGGVYLLTTTAWSLGENILLRRGLP
jgi:YidC/Oxa1 family membrane protein insertase